MPNTNKVAPITLTDLENLHTFKSWLRRQLSLYNETDDIPGSHLAIYLEQIKRMVMKEDNIDKLHWFGLLKNLESKIGSVKRVEVKNEL